MLAASGTIGDDIAAALKAEARRRAAGGSPDTSPTSA
jgi:hypothetical protein